MSNVMDELGWQIRRLTGLHCDCIVVGNRNPSMFPGMDFYMYQLSDLIERCISAVGSNDVVECIRVCAEAKAFK